MKKAKIGELRDHLSRFLDHVREGGQVLVVDRNRPVARIVPLREGAASPDRERLQRLGQRGLVRRGTGAPPDWLGRRRPPKLRGSVLRHLLAERAEGW
jgi:prevent-host-death family protein